MRFNDLALSALVTFLVILVAASVVTYVWSLTVHGAGAVDWETAFVLAIALGVALPISEALRARKGRPNV